MGAGPGDKTVEVTGLLDSPRELGFEANGLPAIREAERWRIDPALCRAAAANYPLVLSWFVARRV